MPMRRGFTMLEMVAAAAMLLALLAVSLKFFHATADYRRTVRQREMATQEVANLMERLAAIPWKELTAGKAQRVELSELARRTLPGAKLTIEVIQPADEPAAKRIAVALAWEDASRRLGQPVRLTAWRYRGSGGP